MTILKTALVIRITDKQDKFLKDLKKEKEIPCMSQLIRKILDTYINHYENIDWGII